MQQQRGQSSSRAAHAWNPGDLQAVCKRITEVQAVVGQQFIIVPHPLRAQLGYRHAHLCNNIDKVSSRNWGVEGAARQEGWLGRSLGNTRGGGEEQVFVGVCMHYALLGYMQRMRKIRMPHAQE